MLFFRLIYIDNAKIEGNPSLKRTELIHDKLNMIEANYPLVKFHVDYDFIKDNVSVSKGTLE